MSNVSKRKRVDVDALLPGSPAPARASSPKGGAREPRGKVFTLRLSETEHAELEAFAAENGLSVSAAIRFLVRRGVRGGA